MNQEKKKQIGMVAFGAVALLVVTYMFVISPQGTKKEQNEATKTEYDEKKQKADTMISKEAEFVADLGEVNKRLEAIEDQMAQGDVFLWMNALLEKFKSTYGLDVDIPSVDRENRVAIGVIPDFPYQAALFRVSGSGHYHDIGKYIETFENDHPFIRVQNITMNPSGSGNEKDAEKLSFTMELVTLLKPAEEEESK